MMMGHLVLRGNAYAHIVPGANGAVTRLRDLGRVEMGASEYALRSLLDNKSAVAVPIFQAPGGNALDISANVRATMADLKAAITAACADVVRSRARASRIGASRPWRRPRCSP